MAPTVRDRVELMLKGIEIGTEYDDPTMSFAARYLLRLAQTIWEENPNPPPHAARSPRLHSRLDA